MGSERDKQPKPLTFESVVELSREILLAEGGHIPTVIAEGDSQTMVTQIPALAETHEGRAQQMFMLGFILAESGAMKKLDQVYLICEAWMSTPVEGKLSEVLPSEDPNRKEILIISNLKARERTGKVAIFEMLRDGVGELRELKQFEEHLTATRIDSPLLAAFVDGFNTLLGGTFDITL